MHVPPHQQSEPYGSPTIGVFDSGFGGLTVLRALLPRFPGSHFVYLGDTARLPYGAKSRETIARYALSSASFLMSQNIELLVVACNTASALALDDLHDHLPIPVVGVIAPGTEAAVLACNAAHPEPDAQGVIDEPRSGAVIRPSSAQVLVLATAATVQAHAYARSCAALGLRAFEKACPLLVPLVEEGWIDHPVTRQVLKIYLQEALAEAPHATTLLLGCTHYPLLSTLVGETLDELNHPMHIVDSAAATAEAAAQSINHPLKGPAATCTFHATDSIEKFRRLGTHFLGQPLPEVHLLDLGG